MLFDPPLQKAVLLRRYKRFLADIALPDGTELTIHCPNTGSMKNCLAPGQPCWYSTSESKQRKYPQTWEIATTPAGHLAGVNTGRANRLVEEAIENQVIVELGGYSDLRREVRYGEENSRIDFYLDGHAQLPACYVEVKNVTLEEGGGQGYFPDSVSTRGSKHLRELMGVVAAGKRGVLCFCVQHSGILQVSPADHIDKVYGETLRLAVAAGVEVIAYGATLSSNEIVLNRPLPVVIPPLPSAAV